MIFFIFYLENSLSFCNSIGSNKCQESWNLVTRCMLSSQVLLILCSGLWCLRVRLLVLLVFRFTALVVTDVTSSVALAIAIPSSVGVRGNDMRSGGTWINLWDLTAFCEVHLMHVTFKNEYHLNFISHSGKV